VWEPGSDHEGLQHIDQQPLKTRQRTRIYLLACYRLGWGLDYQVSREGLSQIGFDAVENRFVLACKEATLTCAFHITSPRIRRLPDGSRWRNIVRCGTMISTVPSSQHEIRNSVPEHLFFRVSRLIACGNA
jgi:hypothetical protein